MEFIFVAIMRKILLFFTLFFQLSSYAQETNIHNYYFPGDDTNAMIGVKNCYIRKAPSTTAQILDSLQIGKEIKVIKSTENGLKLKGISVSWAEIEYTNNFGVLTNGFIWKGFLAVGYAINENFKYLTTIDKLEIKVEEEYEIQNFSISVKILNSNNTVLDQKTFQKYLGESFYFENKTIGSLGLSNLKDIYRISFNGEACGIPSFYYYFGWNGKKIVQLLEKMNVWDADVFYHTENLIFPKEKGGKPDLILKKTEEAEQTEENEGVYHITEWDEEYKWTGEKISLLKKSKIKKYKKKL